MPLTKADFEAVLKIDYKGPIVDQLENSCAFMSRMERHVEETGGAHLLMPVRKTRTTSIGARTDGSSSTIPLGATPGYGNVTFPVRSLYASVRLTGLAMRVSRADKYAFARAQTRDIEDTVTDVKKDFNRQLFGDGSAELAYINANTATVTTTFTIASNLYPTNPAKFLHVGERIDLRVRTGTTSSALLVDTALVSAINSSTQIEMTTSTGATLAVSCSSTASLYRQGNASADAGGTSPLEIFGAYAAISKSNPSAIWGASYSLAPNFGNVDRSVAAGYYFRAIELGNSGTRRPVSTNLLMQGIDAPTESGGGGNVSLLQTNIAIYRVYGTLLAAAKQFEGAQMKLDGAWDALSVNGVPMVKDVDSPDYTVLCIDESTFMLGVTGDWSWVGEDGGSILSRLPQQDQYEAMLVRDCNLMCDKPSSNAKILDVAHS